MASDKQVWVCACVTNRAAICKRDGLGGRVDARGKLVVSLLFWSKPPSLRTAPGCKLELNVCAFYAAGPVGVMSGLSR